MFQTFCVLCLTSQCLHGAITVFDDITVFGDITVFDDIRVFDDKDQRSLKKIAQAFEKIGLCVNMLHNLVSFKAIDKLFLAI